MKHTLLIALALAPSILFACDEQMNRHNQSVMEIRRNLRMSPNLPCISSDCANSTPSKEQSLAYIYLSSEDQIKKHNEEVKRRKLS